jgi:hypothetical protein
MRLAEDPPGAGQEELRDPIPMKFIVTAFSLQIPLTSKQWDRLSRIGETDYTKNARTRPLYSDFTKALAELGAEKIEFNGHFGRNFFCWVDNLDQAQAVTDYLKATL